jgi:endonuclease YncB( thermonuclease family)
MPRAIPSVILGLMVLAQPAQAQTYSGNAISIQDGITFTISDAVRGNRMVRLCGVESLEDGDRAYQRAKSALAAMIDGKTVSCVEVGSGTPCDDRLRSAGKGRIVAQCRVEGKDIADMMVCRGHAVDWETFSGGHYKLPIPDARCK